METKSGYLITFEGGEGSGKTTLIGSVAEQLRRQSIEVVMTREPGGTSLGEMIRYWLLHRDGRVPMGYHAELLLFLAARAQHLEEVIIPALQRGKIVLCDRFNDSTVAYQGGARGLGIERVKQLCQWVCGEVKPHLTFFLDIAPEQGLLRVGTRDSSEGYPDRLDRMEAEAPPFHITIQKVFRQLAREEPKRIHVINAHNSQERVLAEVMSILKQAGLFNA